ncbi:hypothetical protein J6590_006202 [Homalodisca vitripennis]|nr:hypothetical protein J6590_006202 [Homalodisca vitripennis]
MEGESQIGSQSYALFFSFNNDSGPQPGNATALSGLKIVLVNTRTQPAIGSKGPGSHPKFSIVVHKRLVNLYHPTPVPYCGPQGLRAHHAKQYL